MTKDELLTELRKLDAEVNPDWRDYEGDHINADKLLIEYINDPEIAEAYSNVGKWYA